MESVSRYSIVAKLTDDKLNIITAKANLDSDVRDRKQRIDTIKSELADWKSSLKLETENKEKEYLRKIREAERDAKNAEERKASKSKAYDEKVKALDEALAHIQKISESAEKSQS